MSREATMRKMPGSSPVSLAQRIEDLRNREPSYVTHGDTLMLQGMAATSLREQRLSGNLIRLDD
ncbi:hypothetical protein LCM27_09740 [Ruegeria marisrubri]|uniref:Uncharacterized protein n=1 Tax=Ruegeria atlantica TaxID=81569 RepID=A0AA90YQQ9_9RHOB|nr:MULTISPECIES: hypothetical protein [Ruegeria]MCA0906676.1 hypothetical protein [Ruegeria marisrubri]NOE17057.1 hypothetical protein [Ruegeria atlantica]